MSVNYTADDVIAIAELEIGYLEKATNSQLYEKTANAGKNNFTKYAYEAATKYSGMYNGNKNGYAWCDVFVDWCHVQAANKSGGTWKDAQTALCQPDKGAGAGCIYSYQYYQKAGRASSVPQKGAQIFFKDSTGKACHTGLVYKVTSSRVYTIEGNTSSGSGVIANGGSVQKREYARTYSSILGYGLPRYASSSSATAETKTEATTATTATTQETVKTTFSTVSKVLKLYSTAPKWCNGSTEEPVYADTDKKLEVGTLDPYDSAVAIAMVNGAYLIAYNVEGGTDVKVGFVAYSGGTAPHCTARNWTGPTYEASVYCDTKLQNTVGSTNPKEVCSCYGTANGKHIIVYGVDGTTNIKSGVVNFAGGL